MNAVGWWALWILALTVVGWQAIRSTRDEPSARDRIAAEAKPAPVPDTEPGINLAWQDECELLWSVPWPTPGTEPGLRAAAIPEQREEEDR